jgi:hypothetical protein
MKTETFKTVLSLCDQDPLTPRQAEVLTGGDPNKIIGCIEAAELLGISPITMRRIRCIPRLGTTRYLKYKLSDVLRYRESKMI